MAIDKEQGRDPVKEIFVNLLTAGASVDDIFVAEKRQLSHKKDGDAYLTMTLSDKSGNIRAVLWDNVSKAQEAFSEGDYVRVQGKVQQYREALQLVVRKIERVDGGDIDARDFLPSTTRDTEKMLARLMQAGRDVQDRNLAGLLDAFFSDEAFMELFKTAPAAKKMHHAYLGGLLEHTLSIVRLVENIALHYKGINKDLLVAGGILHDVGKVHEFSYETAIDYSDAGRLLGHITIGIEMVEEKLATLKDFPPDLALLLKHMILSHHGFREQGSPEPPKTLEALILYYADDLDAKVTGIRSFMDAQDPGATWSAYHRILERFFYLGKDTPSAVDLET
jgi:3'-5' exoribonuclease